jgi:hypothetical protein
MVTHNPEVAAGAEYTVHMRDGRVVDEGEPETNGASAPTAEAGSDEPDEADAGSPVG